MQYELASSIEIKDLGPSSNRRHVRHSLPRVGRWGEGRRSGGTLRAFFLVHKTDLWKSMSGWQSYYRYQPLYVSAEGSVLKTFITFPSDFYGLTLIFLLVWIVMIYMIWFKAPVWYCHIVPPVDTLQPNYYLSRIYIFIHQCFARIRGYKKLVYICNLIRKLSLHW